MPLDQVRDCLRFSFDQDGATPSQAPKVGESSAIGLFAQAYQRQSDRTVVSSKGPRRSDLGDPVIAERRSSRGR